MVQPLTVPPLVRGEWFPMTWEEFLDWSPSEGQAEWVAGEGIAYVSNSAPHGRLVALLAEVLRAYARVLALGEVFDETMLLRLPTRPSGRMPDVFVVGRSDRDRVHHQWVDGPPLLVVEVISDESVDRDLREKRAEYERAGVPEYLIVDARGDRQGFTYLRLDTDEGYQPVEPDAAGRYHSVALPGFWFDPDWFRQDPLPNPLSLLRRISPEAWQRLVQEVEREG